MKSCLFVIPSLSDGGAERVVSVLSSELAKTVDQVTILVYWQAEKTYSVNSKVKIINLSEGNKKVYDNISIVNRLIKIRSVIKKEHPEVIIPFLPHVCLHVGIATCGLNCKVIQTIRNNPKTAPNNVIRRFIRDLQIKFSQCTIVQNREQLEYFPKKWRKKIYILPNPIDERFLNVEYKGADKFTAVAVGRLTKQKNFPLLINAFSVFAKKHKESTLSIYGDGELKEELSNLIKKNGMSKHIFLKGRVDNLPEIMAHASVFIMSSDFEGMPNSLMEAMAVGVPVISTNCPTGPKELLGDNERGWLVEVGNIKLLTNTLEQIYDIAKSRIKISKNTKEYIKKNFSSTTIVKKLNKICKRIE